MDAPRALAILLVAAVGLAPAAATATGPQPAIVFDDQQTSGQIVIVDAVQLPEGGFVGIHDPTTAEDGELGELVGSSYLLGAGLHQHVPVSLHEPLDEPRPLIAALYEDANQNRVLDTADGHGHHHEGEDRAYTAGDKIIGDEAQVGLHGAQIETSDTVNPLLVGALTALASLALWAVRYR